jgi:signal transduction histidine kinase
MPLPSPTIRLRMTALYGFVFLITGGVLLTLGYLLVRHNLDGRTNFLAVRRALTKGPVPAPGTVLFGHDLKFFPGSPEVRVATAVKQQLQSSALHRLLVEYLAALGGMTIISVVAGWLLAGRALRPLRRIISTARRVSGEHLDERIALQGPADELKELADTFDRMLGRLEGAFASQRHFVANASHELRTPLAIMRTEVDVALADPDAGVDELRRMGEALRETTDRCERLIEGLLALARSEAGSRHEEAVDLGALAGDCVTDLRARAGEADVELRDDLEPAWTLGEPALLERMIGNLVDNAVRHNRPGGFLSVRTRTEGDRVRVEVTNSGEPIAAEEAQRLTEPFHRLDRAREGFGLGLSIVASVVRAHGGHLDLHARAEGGLEVTAELPSAAPGADLQAHKKSPRALTRS